MFQLTIFFFFFQSVLALASQDLFNALSSSTFYSNPSTVTLSQKFGYLNIACEYFEPENVTCQECGWSEGNLPSFMIYTHHHELVEFATNKQIR